MPERETVNKKVGAPDFFPDIDYIETYNNKRIQNNENFVVKGIPYLFFTTPQLNLSESNYNSDSFLAYMAKYYPNILSCLSYGSKNSEGILNTTSPFIRLLSNTAQNLDTRDTLAKTKEIGENYIGTKIMLPASEVDSKTGDEISIRFRDLQDLPVLKLINSWFIYHTGVRRGKLSPTEDTIKNRVIDYTSSIYYFVTDMDGETLQYWAKYTGIVPVSVPFSAFSSDWQTHEIIEYMINFLYSYKEDMNPDILTDFNRLSKALPLGFSYESSVSTGLIQSYQQDTVTGEETETAYEQNGKKTPYIVFTSNKEHPNKYKFKLKFLDSFTVAKANFIP